MIIRTPDGQLQIINRKNCKNEIVFNKKIIENRKNYVFLNNTKCQIVHKKR